MRCCAESPFGAKLNQLDLDGIVEVRPQLLLNTTRFPLSQEGHDSSDAPVQDIHNDVRNKIALLGDASYLASY